MKQAIILFLLLISLSISAQDIIQWRGIDRTGIYTEKGLLKSWPKSGPQLLWHFDNLGEGHSSVAITNDKIYITGLKEGKGQLFVLDMNGKLLNKIPYGPEWDTSYNGSRGTVSISDGKLYIYSGLGTLTCFDEKSLKILWQKNIVDDFKGSNIRWGVNESPLIIGEKIIITPGGKVNNVVALDKNTGNIIWACPGEGDLPAYCSPLYISELEVPLIATMTGKHILGIDAKTGEKLWSYPYENNRGIHPVTPIYDGKDMILFTGGYNKGAYMFRLKNGGRSIEKVWEQPKLQTQHGGMVKIGNYVYAGGDFRSNRYWYCVDWNTGEVKWKTDEISVGAVIADGNNLMYCYTEKGKMVLVNPNPQKFEIISKFNITLGTEQHWAHPVIHKGVLYVRHGDTLMAYDIKK